MYVHSTSCFFNLLLSEVIIKLSNQTIYKISLDGRAALPVEESVGSSVSVWDFLVKKTLSKRLGPAEALASMFSEMQAAVIELKNLAEQSLSREKPEEDSVSVNLTPIMSSVLGMSQAGRVTRYVLPQTQIPDHYHELLSFQAGVREEEEENCQMSLDVEDEELQDSSILVLSPLSHKRRRLDSASSPPARADDSDLSSVSTANTEVESDQLMSEDVAEIRGGVTTTTTTSSLFRDHDHSLVASPSSSSFSLRPLHTLLQPSARPESPAGPSVPVSSHLNYGASLDIIRSSPPPPPGQPSTSQPRVVDRPDAVELKDDSSGKIMVQSTIE